MPGELLFLQSYQKVDGCCLRRPILLSEHMRDVIFLLFHLLTTLAMLIQPGGSRAVVAENLILKQQLIIHSRSGQRAPNLTTLDRTLLGFLSLFLDPRRIARSAIIVKPSTPLRFHAAPKKRNPRFGCPRIAADQSALWAGA